MLDHRCPFLSVPKFMCRRNNGIPEVPLYKLELAWTLSALLLSSQELWTSIENTPLFKSKWHGWMLVYLTKHCNPRASKSRQDKLDVFKSVQMNTISRFVNDKLNLHFLLDAFQDSATIGFIDVVHANNMYGVNTIDYSLKQLVVLMLEENELKDKNVLLFESFYLQLNDSNENNIQETLIFNNSVKFELRVICYTKDIEDHDNNFEAGVYVRHGNYHQSWWFHDCSHHLRLQFR